MQKKIALVTGANRGIGFAVAKGLLQKGITVIASARTDEKAKVTKENLSSYGDIHVYPLEVTQLPSIQKAVQYVHNNFGQLDILINNAGVNYDTWHHVQNADLEEVRQTFETNTFAPWQLIQNFLPLLKKSKAGRIVNVSSGSGAFSSQNGQTPGYSLSKYALNGLTLQFAQALQRDGILVNAVCPGWVRTDMGGSGAPRSPEQGADTIIWAALLENGGPSGKFYRDRKEVSF